ncbi:PAS domain-containing protein [Poseidonibacter ostreae]|jgi:PAS domain S-box-containing protein|uniref:PAS domain-containing protein n=1 Tax=Poseidonibacter ostreae TaxID=2654171 RepID=A0ABQ6VKY7_9BACT|nr:PAS domain-containing protein [Poseidonibacter ostreae]KAB7890893.1 PAS domain-containing protein [Poseidonibacter ostreae]MAC84032.1 PAS sensor domain-containing protein [Arcobacter sp.]|tara:strand:- start:2962 stop:3345 length:384 start_codon:yes stop_codon:yes gene_type:complete
MSSETVLKENAFLVSETDSKGIIKFANEEFCNVAGYSLEELINQPHNMVRHKDMPKAAFEDLWKTVKSGNVWQGYVKNATKQGGFYWVFATVYPYKDANKNDCYISCRRKPSREDIQKAEELYSTMR